MVNVSLPPGQEELVRKFFEELFHDGTPIYSKVLDFVTGFIGMDQK